MDTALLIIMMVVIGALIGGVTNFIAITMLFRPYRALYIGSWRLPFTPGLIPKRKKELAEQIGKIVMNHLLTADSLMKKIKNEAFHHELLTWLQNEARSFLHSEKSLQELLSHKLQVDDVEEKITSIAHNYVDEKLEQFIEQWSRRTIYEAFSNELLLKADSYIPQIRQLILQKGIDYFSSEEGKTQLSHMIDRFLAGKGKIGNMISMFLGNDRLVDKIQPELMKILQDKETEAIVEKLLQAEWEKLKEKKLGELISYVGKNSIIEYVKSFIVQQLPIKKFVNDPIRNWALNYEEKLLYHLLPRIITFIQEILGERLTTILKKLNLEEVIKEQVNSFSVQRLEQIVLFIARRELKMITYLGALLGGMIGFVQGIIAIFMS